jgi:hypothetical protein
LTKKNKNKNIPVQLFDLSPQTTMPLTEDLIRSLSERGCPQKALEDMREKGYSYSWETNSFCAPHLKESE